MAGALLAITSTAAVSEDAFEAALATLPGELRTVNSAGRWRTEEAEGVYRVIVLRGGYERVADRLYIQWVRDRADDQPSRVAATVAVTEINDSGPFTISHTLQAEATNRLRVTVDAHHGYTRERRQFVFFVTTPEVYSDRRAPPSSSRPKQPG